MVLANCANTIQNLTFKTNNCPVSYSPTETEDNNSHNEGAVAKASLFACLKRVVRIDGEREIEDVRNDRSLCRVVVTIAEQPQSEHHPIHY